ncbi:sensor histidine kinase [Falsiroseomonas stagni]|uniref:histidine kinase n=1 Tax=Falsiroseomonas stagni DSM 19981 TaxID=1123062 RepID=A0A1I4CWS5_9PROT|nr:ATP-binding protein [Falsiroseomonas stagni]SFK84667.1 PAS fold-containing protein [Falsiroseomonas stagni DSM 19981]
MLCHRVLQAVSGGLDALDSLGVPALALDEEDRMLRWSPELLGLFPEHAGHIKVGEPYAEGLRRLFRGKLDATELPHIDRYIAEAMQRHRWQDAPYEFLYHGRWIRANVLRLPGIGSLRFWHLVAPRRDGDTLAASMVGSGGQVDGEIIDRLADGLVVRDAEGRILRANRRFAETYGLASPADAIGRSFPDILDVACTVPAENEAARHCWSKNSLVPGAPFELPLPGDRWVRVREHRTHDGRLIGTHVNVTDLVRLRRSAGEARMRAEDLAARLAREIEERKRTEAQLIQSTRMVSLGQMATGLAHELNQPLAIMVLAADAAMLTLQRSGADAIPEALARLDSIATTALRVREIIDHLRSFGGQDDGDAVLEMLDLGEVARRALLLTAASIRASGIALTLSLPPAIPGVMGRPNPLEQAIMSLLLNARDAVVATRRPDGAIRLAVEAMEGQVVLTVADNGGGLSASALRHGLEPFFTTKDVGKGVGLGLALAYTAITACGGSIALGNEDGGAVVRVTLPALAPAGMSPG